MSIDDKFDPMPMATRREQVSDENPAVLANHMRALQREVHAGFEMITQKLLTAIERLTNRFDDMSSRIADLERWQSRTDARLAALEKKRPSRGRKRK